MFTLNGYLTTALKPTSSGPLFSKACPHFRELWNSSKPRVKKAARLKDSIALPILHSTTHTAISLMRIRAASFNSSAQFILHTWGTLTPPSSGAHFRH
eukprot:5741993-Amphidinium_carterae.1